MPIRPVALLVALVLFASACIGSCRQKTDAERAAEERAAVKKRLESSLVLVPYRALKVSVRSAGTPNPPPELAPVKHLIGSHEKEDLVTFVKTLYAARQALKVLDEDLYPTVWQGLFGAPLFPGYDAPMEHVLLAALLFAFDAAAKAPPMGQEIIFYELSRGAPGPGWPWPMKAAGHLARGVAFAHAGYHYAAEEELDTYLGLVEKLDENQRVLLLLAGQPGESTWHGALATGHLVRAWNRSALGRDDKATDDVEAGLPPRRGAGQGALRAHRLDGRGGRAALLAGQDGGGRRGLVDGQAQEGGDGGEGHPRRGELAIACCESRPARREAGRPHA